MKGSCLLWSHLVWIVVIVGLVGCLTFKSKSNHATALFPINVGGMWGYSDKSGHIAIKPSFIDAKAFSEGLAAVKSGPGQVFGTVVVDGLWGYIDESGAIVIDCGFLQAGSFSNGYSRVIPFAVTMSGKLSQIEEVIDRNGHVVDADGRNIIKVPVGVSSQ